ncbi:uncharacterized protein LOC119684535 [Teleopsis dalmanni]|uniref:uncharacterized protein LOC119684535 n=1 Tax=Teleopsis dalmanni TaxID=139649 RepID=UPI0018CE4E4E|nr:uncharacterized protein LOC119684535 [Teleopsis dalmanni]
MVVLQKPKITKHISTENYLQQILLYLQDCEEKHCDFLIEDIRLEHLLDHCKDCAKMAAIPQGAFAACKLRENYRDRDLIIARMKSSADKNDAKNLNSNKKLMEYSPVKYNSKLMNSIWGFYNRYSPHNIKSNDYEVNADGYQKQQCVNNAVASYAIAQNLAMAQRTGKEWCFLEKRN